MKILIIDDERLARQRLRSLVEEIGSHDIIGEGASGEEALTQSQNLQPDIVLLDIRMPGMNGIEAAMHIMKLDTPPAIIFTTAYDEYALQAFDSHAVDYLLKPIRKDRLQQALQNAKRLTRAQIQIVDQGDDSSDRKHISARLGGELRLIPVEDVRYFLAEHKYVTVRYIDGTVLIEDSLRKLEENFPKLFVRVHRNALVSINHIAKLEKDKLGHHRIRLRDLEDLIEVSRRHLPEVRKLMKSM